MAVYVALLRAINVGGTGKLPMADLRALCEQSGFTEVRTYIQSGNVVFRSTETIARVQTTLEKTLAAKLGKPVGVLLRRAQDLERVVSDNPFGEAPPNRVIVFFFDRGPAQGEIDAVEPPDGEELAARGRELYVYYPNGQGRSKLKLPFARGGTGRNMNTFTRLSEMARALARGSS